MDLCSRDTLSSYSSELSCCRLPDEGGAAGAQEQQQPIEPCAAGPRVTTKTRDVSTGCVKVRAAPNVVTSDPPSRHLLQPPCPLCGIQIPVKRSLVGTEMEKGRDLLWAER